MSNIECLYLEGPHQRPPGAHICLKWLVTGVQGCGCQAVEVLGAVCQQSLYPSIIDTTVC